MINTVIKASLAGVLLFVAMNAGAGTTPPAAGTQAGSVAGTAAQSCHRGSGQHKGAKTATHVKGTKGTKAAKGAKGTGATKANRCAPATPPSA